MLEFNGLFDCNDDDDDDDGGCSNRRNAVSSGDISIPSYRNEAKKKQE
jgi:hypothetical protein